KPRFSSDRKEIDNSPVRRYSSREKKGGLKFLYSRYIRQNRESTIQLMMDWSKSDKEMATAGYESVVKLFNDDGSVPEKGFLLVIDELKSSAEWSAKFRCRR